jgi:hypothetical protein
MLYDIKLNEFLVAYGDEVPFPFEQYFQISPMFLSKFVFKSQGFFQLKSFHYRLLFYINRED